MSDAAPDLEPPPPPLLPIARAAAQIGYSAASLYRFANEGKIRLVRLGAKTLVEADELDRFRRENTKPFVPGERVIANAGGHLPPRSKPRSPRRRTT